MNDLQPPVASQDNHVKKKKPALAALLNVLVPGLGYVYAGNVKKGLFMYLLLLLVVVSIRFVAFNFALLLAVLGLVIAFYVYLIVNGYRAVKKDKRYETGSWDVWYVYVLVVCVQVGLRVYVQSMVTLRYLPSFNPVMIPTPAMDPTLQVGDRLMFHETKEIARNQVVVFKWPPEPKTMYIKRCVAMPGDSIFIHQAAVFVNGDSLTGDYTLKYAYLVETNRATIQQRVLDQLGISTDFFRTASGMYRMFLTEEQARQVRALSFLDHVERDEARDEGQVFPGAGFGGWSADNYGPLYVPKKGDRISLTHQNLELYTTCLKYENESVEVVDSTAIIDGKPVTNYEFKDDYYFMMGDNRDNSYDSRYWGFVPGRMILGKALYFYWSKDFNKIGKRIQ